MLGKLAVVVTVMFGFGWALVPIYRSICEVTGLNNLTQVDKGAQAFAANTQVDQARSVTVEFDANARGPWLFKPEQTSMDVHPGELVTVVYEVQNTLDETVAGQAIPSYIPKQSEGYFRKIECFCFRQQTLAPRESRKFPVVFVIDPKLPADVGTITLSYTLFKVEGPVGNAAPAAGSGGGTATSGAGA
ncbi:MAG: cytochrome c oxidase assembly protein [Burkholderiaceae bacterium]